MEIKKWHYSRSMDVLFTKYVLLNIQSYHFFLILESLRTFAPIATAHL